ncbi:hypothetical protein ASPACDRAFT_41882 [Aspergillus aculeatus ATCC 16872]|uniref:F-box domain-containing protein n=1 Tax=Aspergillus aculeatus (strain ATCC 16872 / CBS 172.66 / WB 5094) TaxID=690307 RepID=A0A1L9WZF6_ASPA1|nr:uncharacterized protein ASPACDRAFT_41882 [Aspergillus aculeatus ATCC 16872]OJK01620.1 hypothetical protein ASPACDRAFT_41882 [Aspergillus aculeatus ATCC 16872]
MASGLAYRLDRPSRNFLDIHSAPRKRFRSAVKLYRARCQKPQRRHCPPPPPPPLQQHPQPMWNSLPLEIVGMIFLNLDMIALGTLRLFSIQQLYHEFCHPRCRTCANFGPYLYLPTLSRVCFPCVLWHRRYRVASLENVLQFYRLPLEDWCHLPVIDTAFDLLGKYPMSERMLIDITQAEALHKQRGSPPPTRGASTYQSYYHSTFNSRLASTVAFPYWDPHTRAAESGTYCLGCTEFWERSRPKRRRDPQTWEQYYAWGPGARSRGHEAVERAYRVSDLRQHFRTCPHAVRRRRFGHEGEEVVEMARRFDAPIGRVFRVPTPRRRRRGEGRVAVLRRSARLQKRLTALQT